MRWLGLVLVPGGLAILFDLFPGLFLLLLGRDLFLEIEGVSLIVVGLPIRVAAIFVVPLCQVLEVELTFIVIITSPGGLVMLAQSQRSIVLRIGFVVLCLLVSIELVVHLRLLCTHRSRPGRDISRTITVS